MITIRFIALFAFSLALNAMEKGAPLAPSSLTDLPTDLHALLVPQHGPNECIKDRVSVIMLLRKLCKQWNEWSYQQNTLTRFFQSARFPHLNDDQQSAVKAFFPAVLSQKELSKTVRHFLTHFYHDFTRTINPIHVGGITFLYDYELFRLLAPFDLRHLQRLFISRAQFLFSVTSNSQDRAPLENLMVTDRGVKVPLFTLLDASLDHLPLQQKSQAALYQQLGEYAQLAPFPDPYECTKAWLKMNLPALEIVFENAHIPQPQTQLLSAVLSDDVEKISALTKQSLPAPLRDCSLFISLLKQQDTFVYFFLGSLHEELEPHACRYRLEFLISLTPLAVYSESILQALFNEIHSALKQYAHTQPQPSHAFIQLQAETLGAILPHVALKDKDTAHQLFSQELS
jgi:hypothetical protein